MVIEYGITNNGKKHVKDKLAPNVTESSKEQIQNLSTGN
jgi:hypothetical protein